MSDDFTPQAMSSLSEKAVASEKAQTLEKALVLFSGGMDSAVCLFWALQHFDKVETIGFDYGQRHKVELECRQNILKKLVEQPSYTEKLGQDHVLSLLVLAEISDTALTQETEIRFAANGLPTTFVPARNLLFITLAAAVAYRRGIRHLVLGVCETDYSGYPDCRDDTMKAMQAWKRRWCCTPP
jgi:7-cyano-7-deazaguanine synthase